MEAQTFEVRARHNLTPDQIDELEDRLYAFNTSRIGRADAAQLSFVAEHDGELIGAAAGYTWGGVCELRQVWVHETHRRGGLGRALMRQAIEEARARGCLHVFLATHDFQAPGFYAKLGFEIVAEIDNFPIGHTDILMRLSLGRDATHAG